MPSEQLLLDRIGRATEAIDAIEELRRGLRVHPNLDVVKDDVLAMIEIEYRASMGEEDDDGK